METPTLHLDFLLQDLWHWLLEIEICHHELQEILLSSANRQISEENEEVFLNGMCLVSSLEILKTRLQNEIVSAARDFCTDSLDENPSVGVLGTWKVGSDRRVSVFLSRLRILVSEVKECMNLLRVHEEISSSLGKTENQATKLEWKDGKWVKTYYGHSVEETNSMDLNELGRLKQDFDKQTANILVLEKERNNLDLQVAKLELQLKQCVSNDR